MWEETYKLAYTTHNYRYSTIGETETIKSFTVRDAREFYTNFYAPNNALLIVAGNIDPARVLNTIVSSYGEIPARTPKQRAVTTEPEQTQDRAAVVHHPKATQSMLAKTWHIPNAVHADYPALAMVGKLLTSGKSAILTERMVHTSKVSQLFADVFVGRDLGTFEFFAQIAPDVSFDEIEQIFRTSTEELAHRNIDEAQLQIVKNHLLSELYHTIVTPSSLGQNLGDSFIYANNLSFQIKSMEKIERVTRDDICRVVSKYLLDGKSATVQLKPEES
jgi:predicted Zn-dependent peptidase